MRNPQKDLDSVDSQFLRSEVFAAHRMIRTARFQFAPRSKYVPSVTATWPRSGVRVSEIVEHAAVEAANMQPASGRNSSRTIFPSLLSTVLPPCARPRRRRTLRSGSCRPSLRRRYRQRQGPKTGCLEPVGASILG